MLLLLEAVPPELASWGESCPCHEPLVRSLSEYKRRLFMERVYGIGVRACPCAGMLAPELAAGKLDEVFDTAFRDLHSQIYTIAPLPKASPMAEAEWNTLVQDL